MLLVIFGAGASYDSLHFRPPGQGDDHFRPPLADQLFEPRPLFRTVMTRIPAVQPLIPLLDGRPDGVSLEQRLEEIYEEAEDYSPRKRQLAAVRFYIRDILFDCLANWRNLSGGVSNYKTLFNEIEATQPKECVCVVTFNYDTMLEQSFATPKMRPFKALNDYIDQPDYKIFKVHGSLNWGRRIVDKIDLSGASDEYVRDQIIHDIGHLQIGDDFQFVNGQQVVLPGNGIVCLPAIAIPVVTKSNYEAPAEHIDCLKTMLPNVTHLLIIGWRAGELHFLQMLADTIRGRDVKTMIVSGSDSDAAAVETTLGNWGIGSSFNRFGNGFSHFIARREVRKFLGA